MLCKLYKSIVLRCIRRVVGKDIAFAIMVETEVLPVAACLAKGLQHNVMVGLPFSKRIQYVLKRFLHNLTKVSFILK